MPYALKKVKNGWFVMEDDPDKVFLTKSHKTKRAATQQMQAMLAHAHKVEGEIYPIFSLAQTAYNLIYIITIRKDYSSRIKTILKQYGNTPMSRIAVMRNPIQGFVNTALNAV